MSKRLVYGVGINDLPSTTESYLDGKQIPMADYSIWRSMLSRCYSDNYRITRPAYIGCTVHPDWLIRSNFKKWHEDNYVKGYHLDKDILNPDNKQYSAEHCVYVPKYINQVVVYKNNTNKTLPTGVVYYTKFTHKNYRAQLKVGGNGKQKLKYLGQYSTPEEASAVYRAAKMAHVKDVADKALEAGDIDSRVHAAMYAMKFDSQSS